MSNTLPRYVVDEASIKEQNNGKGVVFSNGKYETKVRSQHFVDSKRYTAIFLTEQ